MKLGKKILGLLLAAMMVLSMVGTAMAEETTGKYGDNNGSITITQTIKGSKYSLYRIFDLESFADTDLSNQPDTDGKYAYKVNEAWSGFFADGAAGAEYVTITDTGYVTWADSKSAADFAKAAIAYAKGTPGVSAVYGPKPDNGVSADNEQVKFENLPLGYYLVDSTAGALCALDTTNPNVTITEKNEKPTTEKKVEENTQSTDGIIYDVDDANIGEIVNFKGTINAQAGAKNYVFHDKMSTGLDFVEVKSVKVDYADESKSDATLTATNDYTVVSSGLDDGCTFHVTFTETILNGLSQNDKIIIEYTGKLNQAAVIGNNGNPNDAKLTYGDNSETEWDRTVTYTWPIEVLKYTLGEEDTKVPLAGVEFELYESDKETKITFEQAKNSDNTVKANYYKAVSNGSIAKITTPGGNDGKFYIEGLDAGTYYLKEVTTPDGYNKLAGDIKVVVSRDPATIADNTTAISNVTVKYYSPVKDAEGKVTYQETETGTGTINVLNNSGTELPSTGGMGTTILYVVGGLLVVAAAVLLMTKKRVGADK